MCRTIRGAFEGKCVKKKLITRLKTTAELQSAGGFDSAESPSLGRQFWDCGILGCLEYTVSDLLWAKWLLHK